jgi:hypothetical protein
MHGRVMGRALDLFAAGLFGLFLVAAVPQAVQRAAGMLRYAGRLGGESPSTARARFSGDAYVHAIDEIRGALPIDRPYVLVEAGRPQDGGVYWVRWDLAPRRAVYLGQLAELADAVRSRRRFIASPRQVVVSYGPGQPPRLVEWDRFVEEVTAAGRGTAPGGAAAAARSPAAESPAATSTPHVRR